MPGFQLLPEWGRQCAILINWPHRHNSCWNPVREQVNAMYAAIVKAVSMNQSVMIICFDLEERNHIQKLLIQANVNLPRVRFFIIPSNDVWTRDYGPLILQHEQQTKILNFQFNGWGNKHPSNYDNLVATELYRQNFFPQTEFNKVDFVLEGGSIEVDGSGTLLTTRSCLLLGNRNPECSPAQIEQILKDKLGIEQILWLEEGGLVGDDTDGHIDALVRFVNSETLCYSQCLDPSDEQFASLAAMEAELKNMKNFQSRFYHLLPLPLPAPIYSQINGKRLPASYTKFLITNHLILVPFFDDPNDEIAKNVLQSVFSGREVIGFPCRSLLENYGSLHGIAMQIPWRRQISI